MTTVLRYSISVVLSQITFDQYSSDLINLKNSTFYIIKNGQCDLM